MKPLRAGDYRHSITIQQTTQTRDAVGGITDTWSTYLTARASVEPLQMGSREYWDAKKFSAEATHLMRMRYRSGVTPKMRVSWDSRLFDIEYPLNTEERNRELILLVKETL